jgi:hypothetical protein
MDPKHVTNTADSDNLVLNACEMLLFGSDAAIKRQERLGAQEAVESTTLPTPDAETRTQYEALGFVFGETAPGDDLFCNVTMPAGWKKQRTDHSMHNDIVDAQGRRRGSFFYKAAFYDRKADLHAPIYRYNVREFYDSKRERPEDPYDNYAKIRIDVIDNATDAILFTSTRLVDLLSPEKGGDRATWWAANDTLKKQARDECVAWLTDNYPEFRSHAAYWD